MRATIVNLFLILCCVFASHPKYDQDDLKSYDDIVPTTDDPYTTDDYIDYNIHYVPPLNASSCIEALSNLATLDAIYVANAATTTMSSFTFWASDIGNYDLCMNYATSEASSNPDENFLRHCVAGRTEFKMTTIESNPFAGICVPVACGARELQDSSVMYFLKNGVYMMTNDEKTNDMLQNAMSQQRYIYFSKLAAVLEYGQSSEATYSCGANLHSMTIDRRICMYCFGLLLFLTIASTVWHMASAGRDGNDPWRVPESFAPVEKNLVEAFSLIKNVPVILSMHDQNKIYSQDRFAVLDGLRVISILWIMLAHTLALNTAAGLLNPEYVMPPTGFLSQWTSQLYFSARFAVDTFFFISGFLVVLSLMKKLDPIPEVTDAVFVRPKAYQWIPMLYLHRLMRILPLYIFCLLLWWKIGIMLGNGPIWYHWEDFIVKCNSSWWTNLLFVNNLIPYMNPDTGECIYISWYLAIDMQCFFVSPIFILLYLRNNILGVSCTFGVGLLSSIAAFIGTYVNNWSAHSFDGVWVSSYTEEVYTKPQYRISSYAVGMTVAMLWHMKQKHHPNFKISDDTARILIAISVFGLVYLIFCGYSAYLLQPCSYFQESTDENPCGSNWSIFYRALYVGFTRFFWAICLGPIVLLSGNNQGEMVQGVLSHPLWNPFAKLTFAVYLLHITVLNVWFYSKGQKLSFTQVELFMSFAGVCFVSFLLAQIATSIVEVPFARFTKKVESMVHLNFTTRNNTGDRNDGEEKTLELSSVNQPMGESSTLLTHQKHVTSL